MKLMVLVVGFLTLVFQTIAQESNQILLGEIIGEVTEVSGVVMTKNGHILVIGDSGNASKIYELSHTGEVIHSIAISNAENIDWEELQLDEHGTLYIGDIGNNLGNRADLKFYVIPYIEEKLNQTSIENVEIISFTYNDQVSTIADKNTPFDAEGFIVLNDEIHLFSKNQGDPTYTKRYTLPNAIGSYTAQLVDSTKTEVWTTGAAYDAESDELVLCSNERLTWYQDYSETFLGNQSCTSEVEATQVEGISFTPAKECFLTEDVESGAPSKLYRVVSSCNAELSLNVWPNPAQNSITVSSSRIIYKIEIHDSQGNRVYESNFENGILRTWFFMNVLTSGIYVLSAHSDSEVIQKQLIKI
ncbi:MAG: T9SS type A sorting domain-containing protein [Flavobacteriales bacterium]